MSIIKSILNFLMPPDVHKFTYELVLLESEGKFAITLMVPIAEYDGIDKAREVFEKMNDKDIRLIIKHLKKC